MGNHKEHEKNSQLLSNSVDSKNRYAATYNGSLSLDYDPRGNTTQYGDLDLTYDVYGKVVGAEEPAMTAVYLYDASDRRVMSQVNGYATYFVLEGDRVLQEVDGNSTQVTKEFVWGSAIDELVILKLDGEIYHAHADALGSTALLTDATGNIVERYDYNPFGACVATDVNGGGLVGNPYRFTGRRLDSETGLYYYRARHYSAEMGRFLSRDPIGIWGDATNWGNAYAYGGNNPLSGWDPTGMGWFSRMAKAARDFGAGVIGGAVESVTLGFVESSTIGDALGANTDSVSYKAGSLTGAIGTGIALNVATSGAFGAVDATVNVTRGAIQVGAGIANGSTESLLSGLTSIGLELLPGALPSGSSAGRGLADVGDDAGSTIRNASGSGTKIEPSAAAGDAPNKGYRAVSDGELADIKETGGFRPEPNGKSMEDKWFSESREGAEKFTEKYDDLNHVVEADVPKDVYDNSFKHPNIDGTGPGFAVPKEDLPRVEPTGS